VSNPAGRLAWRLVGYLAAVAFVLAVTVFL
jgi:hypothetical protein